MKRHIFGYTTEQLAPYIDWCYFFHAWGISPQSFESEKAQEVRHDAERLLHKITGKKVASAIFTLCQAQGKGDNIIIEGTTLPLLRQQHALPGEPNLCLSDFIAPDCDQIGLFATSVNEGIIDTGNDTYTKLLAQTLASRLAEAAATLLHQDVRRCKHLWGYAPNEKLTPADLNAEKYCGIRPAVGYPSLPDQSIIFIIDSLLNLQEIGVTLTQNGAMSPPASVCGLMIAHPAARYFAVGNISNEQLCDYSKRRGLTSEDLHKFLYKNLQNKPFST